jgi:hypothetical protein
MTRSKKDAKEPVGDFPPSTLEAEGTVQAWEQIDTGRYMPRRIRGSLRGRELG